MPSPTSHRVFQCTFEVHGIPAADTDEWRQRSRRLWDREVSPRLQAELDTAFPGQIVRIQRLEIDLRVPAGALMDEIGRAFQLALHDRLQCTSMTGSAGRDPDSQQAPDPPGDSQTDALEVWLLTGVLPWWAEKQDLPTLRQQCLERLQSPSGPAWIRSLVARESRVAQRLAMQFDDAWQLAALAASWPARWPGGPPFFKALAALLPLPRATNVHDVTLAPGFWAACWRRIAGSTPPSARLESVADLVPSTRTHTALESCRLALLQAWDIPSDTDTRPFRAGKSEAIPHSKAPLQRDAPSTAAVGALPAEAPATAPNPTPSGSTPSPVPTPETPGASDGSSASRIRDADSPSPLPDADPSSREPPTSPSRVPPTARGRDPSRFIPDPEPVRPKGGSAARRPSTMPSPESSGVRSPRISPDLATALSPGLPVSQAGLVLVGGYLPPFFTRVGIELATDPASRRNATLAPLLLHYLATGSTHAAEHQLAFAKLLCGLPFDEPVVCDHVFTDSAREEADRLLTALIRHWTALKNTSVPGLRQSFLQRPGLLRDTGLQWQLRVENRAWDVLIQHVPWTFQTLRLPWMHRPLHVEWNAYV